MFLQVSEFIIIATQTEHGQDRLGHQHRAERRLKDGKVFAVFSLEMSNESLRLTFDRLRESRPLLKCVPRHLPGYA
jgi:hypothetical protein